MAIEVGATLGRVVVMLSQEVRTALKVAAAQKQMSVSALLEKTLRKDLAQVLKEQASRQRG